MSQNEQQVDLDLHLNLQTAKISFKELQRPFARGDLVLVDNSLDLLCVAKDFIQDNADSIGKWYAQGKIQKPNDDMAKQWVVNDQVFWAVVVAPWVLVQVDESE